jgi:GxxExxY protein
MDVNGVTEQIIAAAIEVHRRLGPGLLESAYEACLVFELAERRLKVERQKALPVVYKEVLIDCGFRIDLLVEDRVVVELRPCRDWTPSTQLNCSHTSNFRDTEQACSSTSMSSCSRTEFADWSTAACLEEGECAVSRDYLHQVF